MSAPTLTNAWAGSVNLSLQDVSTIGWICRSYLLALKMQLTGEAVGTAFHTDGGTRSAFWTVEQSCNGSTVSTSDLWGTSVVPELQADFAGNPHAWIVLKFVGPVHTLRLCLDLNNGWYPYEYGFVASLDQPFTGGTTTARPQAVNEICPWVLGAPTTGSTCRFIAGDAVSGAAHLSHFTINEVDGTFHHFTNQSGTGYGRAYFGLSLAQNDDDTAPLHVHIAASNGYMATCPIAGRNLNYEEFLSTRATMARLWDNSGYRIFGGCSAPYFGENTWRDSPLIDGVDAVTGELHTMPVWALDSKLGTPNQLYYRGALPDIYLVPTTGIGHVVSTKWRTFGNLAVPMTGNPTP